MNASLSDPRHVRLQLVHDRAHYETLVAEPETEARKLIEFLGLEWNERCLTPQASRRQAMTLSDAQVRKPIYTSSVRRAERFMDHLGPLLDALTPPTRSSS